MFARPRDPAFVIECFVRASDDGSLERLLLAAVQVLEAPGIGRQQGSDRHTAWLLNYLGHSCGAAGRHDSA